MSDVPGTGPGAMAAAFEPSPPQLVARFDAIAARFPGARRRKMFGYPALFVGGNLATSLFAGSWVVRLPDEERTRLLALPGAQPFAPVRGRTMRGYGLLPPDVVADDAALESWVRRAIEHAATIPSKE